MAVDGPQHWMHHRLGAKILVAGLDEPDSQFAHGQKAPDRFGQRREASRRPARFRRDYVSCAVRTSGQDRGFPLLVHGGRTGTLRLGNSREQQILGDS